MGIGGHATVLLFSMTCRRRNTHPVHGSLGNWIMVEYGCGSLVVFGCLTTVNRSNGPASLLANSTRKQPGWVVVSFQATICMAPALSLVIGCAGLRATPHGSTKPWVRVG